MGSQKKLKVIPNPKQNDCILTKGTWKNGLCSFTSQTSLDHILSFSVRSLCQNANRNGVTAVYISANRKKALIFETTQNTLNRWKKTYEPNIVQNKEIVIGCNVTKYDRNVLP